MKYIKKPIPVEAVQWNGHNEEEIRDFYGKELEHIGNGNLMINTLEGRVLCRVGCYLVKGIIGEFWPVQEEIFEATYESLS